MITSKPLCIGFLISFLLAKFISVEMNVLSICNISIEIHMACRAHCKQVMGSILFLVETHKNTHNDE